MTTFTLDTNCILALENNEPAAPAIRALVDAHEQRKANVAIVAISASERQRDRQQLQNFAQFEERLSALGLGNLEILPTIFYWDIAFWDRCLWSDEAMEALERQIHEILVPAVPFLWSDYCKANGLDYSAALPLNSAWGNHKCDVLALWSHIHDARDVFVTNDNDFHAMTKRAALITLGAGRIERPDAAVTLV